MPDSLDLAKLREDLIRDEGKRANLYFDSEGFATFGVGRNVVTNPLTSNEREFGKHHGFDSGSFIELLLNNDISAVVLDLDGSFPWWRAESANCQRGLANFRFQLGPKGFRAFSPTFEILRSGDRKRVAARLRSALWYQQTPLRAERVIRLIES